MKKINYTITDEMGLHARPAGMLAREALKFKCAIKVGTEEKMVDAKRIMGIMSLGIKYGNEIVLTFDGEDENKAEETIHKFLTETL